MLGLVFCNAEGTAFWALKNLHTSAHDTAPSWNSSVETMYGKEKMQMAPDGANSILDTFHT